MTFDRDGLPFVAVAAIPAAFAAALARWRTAILLALPPLAVAAFFRDPDRAPDRASAGGPGGSDALAVLAPADGKVLHAGVPQADVAPPGDWQQVSIFLSLTDVHINRTPVAGLVTEVTHRRGRNLAAFRAESAHQNERSEIHMAVDVDGVTRSLVFRQIVGVAARRVVTRIGVGDQLAAGQRIGLMRFGSRMDVFVPLDVTLTVAVGDRTVAGETVLARWS